MQKHLWEILVPRNDAAGKEYPVVFHQQWDAKLRDIAGGITILRPAKGHWVSPTGKLFVEEMIPVRVFCTEEEIDKIIELTLKHYAQEAVMAYQVSSKVKIKHA